jgi:GT2 family glycosyltransferase
MEQVSILAGELSAVSPHHTPKETIEIRGPYVNELGLGTCGTSIVIVTFNSASTIATCCRSALASVESGDEVIVIDNASEDATLSILEEIARRDPRTTLIRNDNNLGYARAANLGILASHGRNLCLLNPDTAPQGRWLEHMAAHQDSRTGAVGPVADNVAGAQFVGYHLPDWLELSHEEIGYQASIRRAGHSLATRMLMGFCLLVRRAVFDEVGLLDESMFLGADDLEFSLRLRLSGYTLTIALDAFVRHECSVSFQSLHADERRRVVSESDAALVEKLKRLFGEHSVPSSQILFGSEIFSEALSQAEIGGFANTVSRKSVLTCESSKLSEIHS